MPGVCHRGKQCVSVVIVPLSERGCVGLPRNNLPPTEEPTANSCIVGESGVRRSGNRIPQTQTLLFQRKCGSSSRSLNPAAAAWTSTIQTWAYWRRCFHSRVEHQVNRWLGWTPSWTWPSGGNLIWSKERENQTGLQNRTKLLRSGWFKATGQPSPWWNYRCHGFPGVVLCPQPQTNSIQRIWLYYLMNVILICSFMFV